MLRINSKEVKENDTFLALKGVKKDGHDYIEEAIKNGASKIICEHGKYSVETIIVPSTREYLSNYLKDKIDLSKVIMIGITGTNGKTTSAYLTYQLLNLLGIKSSYIGTIGFYIDKKVRDLNNTTPDLYDLYMIIDECIKNDVKVIVMEVSSQALSYDRLTNINYSIIGFTNLTEDHLDYHKTMENYLNAKLLILDHLKDDAKIIVNSDDPVHDRFKKEGHKFITFGFNGDYKINNFDTGAAETKLNFSFDNKDYDVVIPLTSKFNVYNYLTMLSIVHEYGIDINKIIKETPNLKAPKGRCETYKVNHAYAIVDYAHTPDAVEKVITAYNELKKGKVITIIGCGGDRDPKKRPIMGSIATELSDYVIFSNDNPRTENPEDIMKDILEGVKKDNYEVILDRREAIKHGIDIMKPNDILLILGKGHENYQIIGKTKIHLDDAEEVLNYKSN